MYVNSGYLHNSRTPFKEKVKPLRILSAGTYQLHSWPKLPTWRPRGRVDWQLIYIAAGKGHFIIDHKDIIVPAGNMILFQPKEEQHYYYLGEDRTEIIKSRNVCTPDIKLLNLIHIICNNGCDVRKVLQSYDIPMSSNILCTGLSREYEDYFRKMRDELVACRWGYEEMLTYLFRELLLTIHRRMEEDLPRFSGFTSQEVDLAKEYFTEHYNEEIIIEEYARSRHVSTSWFNKLWVKTVNGLFRLIHIKKRVKVDEHMNIQESEEFQTSKFFCKTDFDMKAIAAEEADYKKYPLPMPYKFKSKDARERILYANFYRVNKEVEEMIKEVQQEFTQQ